MKACYCEGKKYMWDGREYEGKDEAAAAAKTYRERGFETQTMTEDGKVLLYTRRVVTEVVVTDG